MGGGDLARVKIAADPPKASAPQAGRLIPARRDTRPAGASRRKGKKTEGFPLPPTTGSRPWLEHSPPLRGYRAHNTDFAISGHPILQPVPTHRDSPCLPRRPIASGAFQRRDRRARRERRRLGKGKRQTTMTKARPLCFGRDDIRRRLPAPPQALRHSGTQALSVPQSSLCVLGAPSTLLGAGLCGSPTLKHKQTACQRRGKKVINIKVCTWHGCEKPRMAAKSPQNGPKTRQKTAKSCKFALAHLTQGTPSAEKSPPGTGTARAVAGRTPPPGPVGYKKPPKNYLQNSRQKVIHNSCPRVTLRSVAGRLVRRDGAGPLGRRTRRCAFTRTFRNFQGLTGRRHQGIIGACRPLSSHD